MARCMNCKSMILYCEDRFKKWFLLAFYVSTLMDLKCASLTSRVLSGGIKLLAVKVNFSDLHT